MPSEKTLLRRLFLASRRELSAEQREEIDNGVLSRLLTLEYYQKAQTVFLYCSTAEELDTSRLMQHALEAGKRVCVPLCTAPGVMEARIIERADTLRCGKYGIPEPPHDAPAAEPAEIDLCIVPCLAADEAGYRLGYGGGYYDRFLGKTTAVSAILCAESRFLKAVPRELHDRACTLVITERRVHIAKQS